jgi:hypothetical protein
VISLASQIFAWDFEAFQYKLRTGVVLACSLATPVEMPFSGDILRRSGQAP